jgi:hypothetical protein
MSHARGVSSHFKPSKVQFVHGWGFLETASQRTLRLRHDRQALLLRGVLDLKGSWSEPPPAFSSSIGMWDEVVSRNPSSFIVSE